MEKLPQDSVQTLLQEIIKEEGFIKYQINVANGSNKGDNYMGIINRVDVIDENNENNKLNLILKYSTRNKNFRNIAPFNDVYSREAYMYQTIFPAFEEFEKSLGVGKPFSSYAKLYKCCVEEMDEVLIMDNKKEQGYAMTERQNTLSFEHCKLVLEELGHLHAISFAMKKLNPELFTSLIGEINKKNIWENLFKEPSFSKHIQTYGIKALNALSGSENLDDYRIFKAFNNHIIEHLLEATLAVDEYSILIHGDCWSNNMLFRYQNSDNKDTPSDICLLDWQVSQLGSAARDLSYFIYNSTNKEILDQNFDNMIQIYYNSLSDRLTEMGCDSNALFPFSALELQMKKYFHYGLILSCFAIHLFTSDIDEIPELSIVDFEPFVSRNVDVYNERIIGNILHAIGRKFI